MDGNKIGGVTGETAPSVCVKTIVGTAQKAYCWNATTKKLEFTEAGKALKVAEPTIVYDFVKDAAWTALDPYGDLTIDHTTGQVSWNNKGAELQKTYKLSVKATFTFDNVSVVECKIPVTIKGKN